MISVISRDRERAVISWSEYSIMIKMLGSQVRQLGLRHGSVVQWSLPQPLDKHSLFESLSK